jgi:preprotein translocase subunit SecA
MDGRRYSDGHQAIEAKENVKSKLQHKPLQRLRYRIISECTTNWEE